MSKIEQNELNVATHWVIETGADCDGCYTRGKVWPFVNLELAEEYAWECAEWSDGMGYYVVKSIDTLKAYCYDHQLFAEDYYYINKSYKH